MAHLFLDDPNALLDPSLRLELLLLAQEAIGLPDSTAATSSAGHHGDQADAMTMQLIQDMFFADLAMTQEEEQLRRDKALAE
ncbi:hypothetical protein AMAG_18392 [Allomyces macrogynus ATCC 38327]|uniref:Uncharacterized protein n=1 Tax=Allomyces macrogynus (strain ATCC 38327) TaxID=578462 RepID=A0A0L0S6W6_ALLM3|nr:hypothetical protein AMAG_18392 [Allomyces macrogynus ATCC 38327]|eukprot:KNE58277.1 hypothetical protein AMAG_18392 [Allomyces macrogynus ATCC 38327]